MAPPIKGIQKAKNFKSTLKKLLKNLKLYLLPLILGLLCAGISTVLAIIGPDMISKIGKLVINAPIEMNEVTTIAIRLVIIYVSSFIFMFLQSYILSGVTAKLSKNYRTKISQKINDLPLRYLDTTPTGDVLSRVTNDVDLLCDALNNSLSSIITCITTVIGSLVMMLSYSWKLTLVAILILPVSMLVISIMFKFSQKYKTN